MKLVGLFQLSTSSRTYQGGYKFLVIIFPDLKCPPSPRLQFVSNIAKCKH